MKLQKFTEKSFNLGMVILALIIISLLSLAFKSQIAGGLSDILIGLPIIVAGILGIIGSIFAIKSFKESTNFKKVLAIVINFSVVGLFLALMIANIIDILKLFN